MSEDKHPQHVGRQFNDLVKGLKNVEDPMVERWSSPGRAYKSAETYQMHNMMQRYAQDDTLEAQGLATPSDATYHAKHAKTDHYGRKIEPQMGNNINLTVHDAEGDEHQLESMSMRKGKHSGKDAYEFLDARDKQVHEDYHADTDFSEYFKD